MARNIACFGVLLCMTPCALAEPVEDITPFLTGQTSKIWVQTAFVTRLGSAEACEDGHDLIFHADGAVQERRCDDGAVMSTDGVFEISDDGIDTFVTFGSSTYRLSARRFDKLGLSYEEIVMRIEGGKQAQTEDRILQRQADKPADE